jgi:hypothetical protein
MTQPNLRESPVSEQRVQEHLEKVATRERVAKESGDSYRRSVNEVNRARDSDIEKALRS